jgi:hypothetical protein
MNGLLTLIILGFLGVVFKVVVKIARSYECPDDEQLMDYYNGRLKRAEELRREITNHLGVCEKCQQRIIDLSKK